MDVHVANALCSQCVYTYKIIDAVRSICIHPYTEKPHKCNRDFWITGRIVEDNQPKQALCSRLAQRLRRPAGPTSIQHWITSPCLLGWNRSADSVSLRHTPNLVSILAHRLRRCPNIEPTSGKIASTLGGIQTPLYAHVVRIFMCHRYDIRNAFLLISTMSMLGLCVYPYSVILI